MHQIASAFEFQFLTYFIFKRMFIKLHLIFEFQYYSTKSLKINNKIKYACFM
jgi:hypothetical protein